LPRALREAPGVDDIVPIIRVAGDPVSGVA
jgi:hypothetical protein